MTVNLKIVLPSSFWLESCWVVVTAAWCFGRLHWSPWIVWSPWALNAVMIFWEYATRGVKTTEHVMPDKRPTDSELLAICGVAHES